jgi:hypothetical protein
VVAVDQALRMVGLILRAPFFVIALVVLAVARLVDALFTLAWFFVVLPLLFGLIKVPVLFLAASFRNRGSEQLEETIRADLDAWKTGIGKFPQRFRAHWSGAWDWFVTGGE